MGARVAKPNKGESVVVRTKSSEIKLILLGSGETGKSTFHKQVKAFYDPKIYEDEEIQVYKGTIYTNILVIFRRMSKYCLENDKFEKEENMENAMKVIKLFEDESDVNGKGLELYTQEVHKIIENLWNDSRIQSAFQKAGYEYNIIDGTKYFFEKLPNLDPLVYIPTSEDILRCRRKTVGLNQTNFVYEGAKFSIFDIGGQRSERRKWASNYEGSNGIIYFASLSEYDQKCYEDDITNRMSESMELFEETINNPYFREKPIILILNKNDLFAQKILENDLKCAFPEYEGGCDYEKALEFIKKKYSSLDKGKDRLQILTCSAISKEDVENIMKIIQKYFFSKTYGKNVEGPSIQDMVTQNALNSLLKKKEKAKPKKKEIRKIGSGAFGKVYLCLDTNNREVVVKKVFVQDENLMKNVIDEYQVTQTINHPNILKYENLEMNIYDGQMRLEITTEYCQLGDLKKYLLEKEMDVKLKIYFGTNIVNGLNEIHSKNIIHRDLKPENIFISKGIEESLLILKIGDFGLIKRYEENFEQKSQVGSPRYMSFEMLKGDKYDFSTDIFSFGCILFEIITQKFNYNYPLELLREGTKEKMKNDMKSLNTPDELMKIVFRCLSVNKSDRPSSTELINFFDKFDRNKH